MKIIFNTSPAVIVMGVDVRDSGKIIFDKTKRSVLFREKLGMSDIESHPQAGDGVKCRRETIGAFA